MAKVGVVGAIKSYFERDDGLTNNGPRKVNMTEIKKALNPNEWVEFGRLCAAELDGTPEIDTDRVQGFVQ